MSTISLKDEFLRTSYFLFYSVEKLFKMTVNSLLHEYNPIK